MLQLNNQCQISESNCALGQYTQTIYLGNTTLIFKCPCQIFITPVAEVEMAIFQILLENVIIGANIK